MADQRLIELGEVVGKMSGILMRHTQSCITCENFIEGSEKCGLNNLRPPAKVIAFGCECFIEILPF